MIELTKEIVPWERAQEWLATLDHAETYGFRQRNRSEVRLAQYLEEMKAGRFRSEVAAPMAFHKLGFLVDGSHRATSQVRAKATMTWWVMRGLEDADVRVLDVGKRRTVPDVFRMLGHKHTIRLSSVVRKLYVLAGGSGKEALSPPLAEKILELHPGIHESVSIGKMVPSHVAPDTNFAVAYFLGAYIDKMPERALEYVNIVAKSWKPNGEFPESSSNGASKTRELLVTLKHECGGRMRIDPDLAMKHAVYGWQLYRDKKIVKALKVPSKLEIDNWDLNMCLGSNKGKRNARKSSVRA